MACFRCTDRFAGIRIMIVCLSFVFAAVNLSAQSSPDTVIPLVTTSEESFRVVRVAAELQNPWGLAFLPDGSYLITERPGRLLRISPTGLRTQITGLPDITAAGQGGLLDIVLHPDFRSNRFVYFTYASPGRGGSSTALARARLEQDRLADLSVLWVMERRTSGSIHYGSRLAFGSDGTLYMTTGERGDPTRARNPLDSAGKLLRFREDGGIPQDNPFVGREEYLPEIYTLGHRNAQGLALRPGTDQIWLSEHGPRGGDEINLIKKGADYGWPLTTYGVAYSGAKIADSPTAPGIEPPVLHWTPSIAPSGLAFYDGDAFRAWKGDLLSGALAGRRLVRIVLQGDRAIREEVLIQDTLGRIRDVRVGPDGFVYLLTDAARGELLRLEPVR